MGDFEKVLQGKQNHWYLHSLSQVLANARGSNTINFYRRHFSNGNNVSSLIPRRYLPMIPMLLHTCWTFSRKNKSFRKYQNFIFCYKIFSENHRLRKRSNRIFLPYLVLEGNKRTSQKISRKELPITTEYWRKLYKIFGGKKMNLKNLRTTLIYIFSFMGFLRYSEVSNLRMLFVIHDSYMAMFTEKSKMNIYRNGNWLYLAKLKFDLCPITLFRRYMKLAQIDKHSYSYIFRGLCKKGTS